MMSPSPSVSTAARKRASEARSSSSPAARACTSRKLAMENGRLALLHLHDEHVHREDAAVRPPPEQHVGTALEELAGKGIAGGRGPARARTRGGQEHGHGVADEVGVAIPEQRLRAGVEGEDAEVAPEADDGVAGRLEERHPLGGVAPPGP